MPSPPHYRNHCHPHPTLIPPPSHSAAAQPGAWGLSLGRCLGRSVLQWARNGLGLGLVTFACVLGENPARVGWGSPSATTAAPVCPNSVGCIQAQRSLSPLPSPSPLLLRRKGAQGVNKHTPNIVEGALGCRFESELKLILVHPWKFASMRGLGDPHLELRHHTGSVPSICHLLLDPRPYYLGHQNYDPQGHLACPLPHKLLGHLHTWPGLPSLPVSSPEASPGERLIVSPTPPSI